MISQRPHEFRRLQGPERASQQGSPLASVYLYTTLDNSHRKGVGIYGSLALKESGSLTEHPSLTKIYRAIRPDQRLQHSEPRRCCYL